MHDTVYEHNQTLSLERRDNAHNKSLHTCRKITADLGLSDVHLVQWFSNFPNGNNNQRNSTSEVGGIAFNRGACSKLKVSVIRGPDRGILQTAEVCALGYLLLRLICI